MTINFSNFMSLLLEKANTSNFCEYDLNACKYSRTSTNSHLSTKGTSP